MAGGELMEDDADRWAEVLGQLKIAPFGESQTC